MWFALTGLALAMLTRIALLFSIVWLTRLTRPWLRWSGYELSGRDLVLLLGGLFLLGKSVVEIHHMLERSDTILGNRHLLRLDQLLGMKREELVGRLCRLQRPDRALTLRDEIGDHRFIACEVLL